MGDYYTRTEADAGRYEQMHGGSGSRYQDALDAGYEPEEPTPPSRGPLPGPFDGALGRAIAEANRLRSVSMEQEKGRVAAMKQGVLDARDRRLGRDSAST